MLFMVIEHFRPDQAPAIYRRFREKGRLAPEALRYLHSWVDLDFGRCYQVMEGEESDLKAWVHNWQDLVEFEIIPVRTSAEAAAMMASESANTA